MKVRGDVGTTMRLETLQDRNALMVPTDSEGVPYEALFVMQPWGGKREAMYTAMCLIGNDPKVEALLTTDSDTIFDSESLRNLLFELRRPEVGCVAGECRILNKYGSFIAYISDVRYWFAFNVERACQSVHSAVVCVSGPSTFFPLMNSRSVPNGRHQRNQG